MRFGCLHGFLAFFLQFFLLFLASAACEAKNKQHRSIAEQLLHRLRPLDSGTAVCSTPRQRATLRETCSSAAQAQRFRRGSSN